MDRLCESIGRNDQDRIKQTASYPLWRRTPFSVYENRRPNYFRETQEKWNHHVPKAESTKRNVSGADDSLPEPYAVLFQDLDGMFRRSESLQLGLPQAMNSKLSALPTTQLNEWFNCFQVHIFMENIIILHYKIKLFNFTRRFNFRSHYVDTSVDSAGYYFVSWEPQSFISGKYYVQLNLKDSWNWAVGVCKGSWLRTNLRVYIYFFLCVWRMVLITFSSPHAQYSITIFRSHWTRLVCSLIYEWACMFPECSQKFSHIQLLSWLPWS